MMKTHIFDFDGTLVDSMPTWTEKVLNILRTCNISYPDDILRHSGGFPHEIGVFQQNKRILTAEAFYGEQFIIKFLRRHNTLLNAEFRTDIEDLRTTGGISATDGKSGIKMAACAATADHYFPPISPFGN